MHISCIKCENLINEELKGKILKSINWNQICDSCHFERDEMLKIPGCDHKFCSSCLKRALMKNVKANPAGFACPKCPNLINEEFLIKDKHWNQTCDICFNYKSIIRRIYHIEECNHVYCKNCLHESVKTQIFSGELKPIKCPNPLCLCLLKDDFLFILLLFTDISLKYKQFQDFLGIIQMFERSELKFCIRPNCRYIIEKQQQEGGKVVCRCGQKICFLCGKAWHSGISCKEIADKDKEMLCPSCPKCFAKIEKKEGYDHIICLDCNHEFCCLCGMDWNM